MQELIDGINQALKKFEEFSAQDIQDVSNKIGTWAYNQESSDMETFPIGEINLVVRKNNNGLAIEYGLVLDQKNNQTISVNFGSDLNFKFSLKPLGNFPLK
jgi:hypothetical protein